MKTTLSRFIRSLVIFSSILALAGMILLFLVPKLLSPAIPWLLLLFFAITFAVFFFGMKSGNEKISRFVNYYLITSMLKMFLLLIITAIYIYLKREDAIRFSVSLLIMFFSYLVFEVVWLLKLKEKQ
jgi:hypothetical protein